VHGALCATRREFLRITHVDQQGSLPDEGDRLDGVDFCD